MFEHRNDAFGLRDPARSSLEEDIERELAPAPAPASAQGFQLPAGLWAAMFACYATFMASLAIATGGSGQARMVLAIAALFMLVYFATASILASLGGADKDRMDRRRPLQTLYSAMAARDVWIQVLSIPAALVLFGVGIAVISSLVVD